jgi:serine/threonine protein kinase
VLDALGFAHARGIVHRDIKPSNIMVAVAGGHEVIKVMDFGIAKALGGVQRTATGAHMGTLHYMSPEQCKGADAVDHRTDIYSLGVTLYEMATGRIPFDTGSEYEMMTAHIQHAPPPPRQVHSGISPNLEAVILRAMAKDPAARFQNAAEFREALEQAGHGIATYSPAPVVAAAQTSPPRPQVQAVQSSPPPISDQVPGAGVSYGALYDGETEDKPRSRSPIVIVCIAGAVVVLGLVSVCLFSSGRSSRRPESTASYAPSSALEPAYEQPASPTPAPSNEPPPPAPVHRPAPPVSGTPQRIPDVWASASSFSRAQRIYQYDAAMAIDGEENTWWQESAEGDGIGEWLQVSWSGRWEVSRIRIVPGYMSFRDDEYGDRWPLNNRVARARISFSSGSSFEHSFPDQREWHTVNVSPPVRAQWVKVTILSVHESSYRAGRRWHDSGISEVEIYGVR